jgi:hypothetical protein
MNRTARLAGLLGGLVVLLAPGILAAAEERFQKFRDRYCRSGFTPDVSGINPDLHD